MTRHNSDQQSWSVIVAFAVIAATSSIQVHSYASSLGARAERQQSSLLSIIEAMPTWGASGRNSKTEAAIFEALEVWAKAPHSDRDGVIAEIEAKLKADVTDAIILGCKLHLFNRYYFRVPDEKAKVGIGGTLWPFGVDKNGQLRIVADFGEGGGGKGIALQAIRDYSSFDKRYGKRKRPGYVE